MRRRGLYSCFVSAMIVASVVLVGLPDTGSGYASIEKKLNIDKEAFDETTGKWVDEIKVFIQGSEKIIRFRCVVDLSYIPVTPGSDLQLSVVDHLPEGMEYINGSSNYPVILDKCKRCIIWPDLPTAEDILVIYYNVTFRPTAHAEGVVNNHVAGILSIHHEGRISPITGEDNLSVSWKCVHVPPIWPMFMQNPQHTGQCSYPSIIYPRDRWNISISSGRCFASCVIDGMNNVYLGFDGKLYSISPQGVLRWVKELDQNTVASTPSISSEGIVCVAAYNTTIHGDVDGTVYAFDVEGNSLWKTPLGGAIYAPLTISGNTLYTRVKKTSGSETLYAICLENGTIKWWMDVGEGYTHLSSPAIYNDEVFALVKISAKLELWALSAKDGSILWKASIDASGGNFVFSSPSVSSDGKVFVMQYLGKLSAIDSKDGSVLWCVDLGDASLSTPAVLGDVVYACVYGDKGSNLYAVSAEDGSIIWHCKIPRNLITSSPSLTDKVVYISASNCSGNNIYSDATLYAISLEDGTILWEKSLGNVTDSSVAIASDETLYLASQKDGYTYIYAIGENRVPIAVNDYYSVSEDSTLFVSAPGVMSNDYDPDGDEITAELVEEPIYGSVELLCNGSFTYQPPAGFHGEDRFIYRVYDGISYSNKATVYIDVEPLNDAPNRPALVSPSDGATDVSINPTLTVHVTDPDGDSMDVYFYGREEGVSDFDLIGSVSNVANNSDASIVWSGLKYSTTYEWYAVANDGQLENTSSIWTFTTRSTYLYTLTVRISPQGSGYLYIHPPREYYHEDVELSYEKDTYVTITACPYNGYIFDHWSGDVSGSENPVTVVMNLNKTITAVFEVQPEISFSVDDSDDTITVTSVSPSGISWDDIEIYCYNDTDSTYIDMDGEVNAGDIIYVRDANLYGDVTVNITWKPSNLLLASFDLYIEEMPTYYTLTLGIDPDGAGYLYVDPPGDYFEDAEIDYEEGTTVTITAHAYDGYIFDHWSGDASGSSSTIQITMDEDKEITAHFSLVSEVTINITRPEPYYLYVNDKKVFPMLFRTLIIGPITIEVEVSGEVDHVAFFVGEDQKHIDYTEPFNFTWDERAFGSKKISVKAYDSSGNILAENHINVTVINFNRTRPSAVVKGTVYDYNKIINKKIPWAKVVAYKWTEDGWQRVDRDRTGRFIFRKGDYKLVLEPGYYKIEATARGYDYETKYVELSKGDKKKIDFYLNETVTLKGKVKAKGLLGRGIRGANITAIRDDGKIYTTKSKLFGKYRLPLPPGNYTIIVDATSKGYRIYTETGVKVRYKIFRDVIKKNFYLEESE